MSTGHVVSAAHYEHADTNDVCAKLDTLIALMREQAMRIAPREVMSAKEAAAFVGKPSVEAFTAWRTANNVKPCAHGRYSLRSLKSGMERESRKTYVHAEGGE